MLRFASARPSLQGLRPRVPRRPAPRLAAQRAPSAVMGGYQYEARADKLRSRGVEVYEFGGRVLREGCFGEDVLQLQNWLAEESYYSPVDGGYTGYFGSVTKESLQAWQRDNGVQASGAFDAASKRTYLRTVEARAEATQAQAAYLQSGTVVPTAEASTAAQAASTSTSAGSGAVLLVMAVALAGFALWKRLFSAKGNSSVFVSSKKAKGASPLSALAPVLVSSDLNTVAVAEEAAAVLNGEGEEENGEEEDNAFKPSSPSGLRRLSDDELQRYIAPFKGGGKAALGVGGGIPTRSSAAQRPAPRPLVLSPEATNKTNGSAKDAASSPTDGSASASRHGTYFGGRQVLDRVKDYLIEEGGLTVAPGSAEDRLQHLAYDMRARRGTKARNTAAAAVPSSPPAAASPQAQQARQTQQQQAVCTAPEQPSFIGSGSFEDVPAQQQQKLRMPASAGPAISFGAAALLSGTDLEAAPERPLRPVPVQRAGRAAAATVATVTAVQQGAKRPVPVVKSSKAVGGATEKVETAVAAAADPNAVMVLHTKPVKLHKPARLARTLDLSNLSDGEARA